ncbi:arrestin domain-containing protein 4-like [Oppia nitens]|uniref:arrestin domain-containing protein 4-like n=1 Tax=Oppia nitens TaxID=1686743 RepID=UPI0023D9AB11|nr:arrestin domain-containing protein 4-like [Oppia nitens]
MLVKISLVLDRPVVDTVYTASDIISGHLVVENDQPLPTSAINNISLIGEAHCGWIIRRPSKRLDENRNYYTTFEDIPHEGHYECLDLKYYPLNAYPSVLNPGYHKIQFEFQLPNGGFPSTYEGKYGHIRYWIEAQVDTQLMPVNEWPYLAIVVNGPAHVSNHQLSQRAYNSSTGMLNNQPIYLRCELDTMGQREGQDIPVHCIVDNQSDKDLILKASLKRQVMYYAPESRRKTTETVVRNISHIIERTTRVYKTVQLFVPRDLPVVCHTCPVIDIRYTVSVVVDNPDQSFEMDCELPVILND